MPDSQLSHELDGVRRRLEAAIADGLSALESAHAAALDTVRRDVRADAEGRLADQLAGVRAEAEAVLAERISATRAEAETRLASALEAAAADADRRVEAAREEAVASAARQQPPPGIPDTTRLLDVVRAIDSAATLSGVLEALTDGAAALGTRATLLLRRGAELRPWRSAGMPLSGDPVESGTIVDQTLRSAAATSTATGAAPAFAGLADGRTGLAVPVSVDGVVVAVLYADDAAADRPAPGSWGETVIVLARHASVCLTQLTLLRSAQAVRVVARRQPDEDDQEAAARFARLVVSEIKLYHEAEVRAGREHRDLLTRLAPEIDRARASFDARVPSTLAGRDTYFHRELVQILAGGDAGLLGGPA